MKRLHGEASATVDTTAARCLEFLADIAQYPDWYPQVVRAADVVAKGPRDAPSRARMTLRVSRGPLEREFRLLANVEVGATGVTVARIPHDGADKEEFAVSWKIEEQTDNLLVHLSIDANLAVPRFLPLGDIGDELAADFVSAMARRLRSEA